MTCGGGDGAVGRAPWNYGRGQVRIYGLPRTPAVQGVTATGERSVEIKHILPARRSANHHAPPQRSQMPPAGALSLRHSPYPGIRLLDDEDDVRRNRLQPAGLRLGTTRNATEISEGMRGTTSTTNARLREEVQAEE